MLRQLDQSTRSISRGKHSVAEFTKTGRANLKQFNLIVDHEDRAYVGGGLFVEQINGR
jgi:hypothetical protein